MDIVNQVEAKELGLDYYFDGEFCADGHMADKLTNSGACYECLQQSHEKHIEYFENKKTRIDRVRTWRDNKLTRQNDDLQKGAERRASTHKNRDFLFESKDNFIGQDIVDIYNKQEGCCVCCYVEFKDEPYEIDHKISLKLGGNNSAKNIQLLCKFCNVQKSDMDYYSWISLVRYRQVKDYLIELVEEGY